MAKMTRRELAAAFFVCHQGWHVQERNSDYWVLTHKDAMFMGIKLFLGPQGAIRKGTCKTKSVSIDTPMLREAIKNWAEKDKAAYEERG